MKTTLLLTAHLSGAEGLDKLLQQHSAAQKDLHVLGAKALRNGPLAGMLGGGEPSKSQMQRAKGRMKILRSDLEARGMSELVVSDRAVLGSLRECLTMARLYPSVQSRMKRVAEVIGQIDQIVLVVQSQETFWSAAFDSVWGLPHQSPFVKMRAAYAQRRWADVVSEISQTCPKAQVWVGRTEEFEQSPLVFFAQIWGQHVLSETCSSQKASRVVSAFTLDQSMALRQAYEDDVKWLRSQAIGNVRYVEAIDKSPHRPQPNEPSASAHTQKAALFFTTKHQQRNV